MPWPPKQRTAIFLDIERRKGTRAAKAFMHRHGYGKGRALRAARKKRG
jgi:hypothetical protein